MGYTVAVMASKLLRHFSVLLFHFFPASLSEFLFPSTNFHVIFSPSSRARCFSHTSVPALTDLSRMCTWDGFSSFQTKCPFLRWVGHSLRSAAPLRPFGVFTTRRKFQIPGKWAACCNINSIPLKVLWILTQSVAMNKLQKLLGRHLLFGCFAQTPVQSLKGFSKVTLAQGCESASPSCPRLVVFNCQWGVFSTS